MQDLFLHFQAIHVEAHMFASQWLLTMFTAKFPLCLVYHFIDILLCEVSLVHCILCYLVNLMVVGSFAKGNQGIDKNSNSKF